MNIHKTAIVSDKAKLADDIEVGPYTVITDNVTVGGSTKIGANCLIDGYATIGSSCEVFTGAVIGSAPQDLKYKGEKSFLEIGDNNIIREYCTFNPGTGENGKTKVGSNNLFMAYSHVAHDCNVGSNCIIANNGTLAGFVTIEDRATIGGLTAIHQFARIGTLSIIGGCSKVVQDIPPYSTCDGHPAMVYGLNLVGLRRHDVPRESIKQLNHVFNIFFNMGLSVKHAIEKIEKDLVPCKEVAHLIDFAKNSQRGMAHSCRAHQNKE